MINELQSLPDPSTMTEQAKKEEIEAITKRLKELRATPRSDWHRIFEYLLREEARPYGEDVEIRVEQELGVDPPRVDYLILDDMKRMMRGKEIFSIFRQHNIVEYKNPDDALNSRVVSKIIGYANFYISLAKHEKDRPRNEVSISIFRATRNQKMFSEMFANGTLIRTETPGIYHVQKLTDLPFQIVITDELEGDEYAAYRVLTDHAREEDVKTISDIKDDLDTRELKEKLLDFVSIKNPNLFNSNNGGDEKMGNLMNILRPEIEKEYAQRDRINLFTYVIDGDMALENAARRAGLTPEQFKKDLESYKESKANSQSV